MESKEARGAWPQFVLGVMFAVLVGLVIVILFPFLKAIIWAVIVSMALWPWYQRLKQSKTVASSYAASLMALLVVAGISGIIFPLVYAFVSQLEQMFRYTESWILADGLALLLDRLEGVSYIGKPLHELALQVKGDRVELVKAIATYRAQIITGIAFAAKGALRFLVNTVIVVCLCYAFFRNGERIGSALKSFFCYLCGDSGQKIVVTSMQVIRGVFLGVFATAFAQGALACIGYIVAGTPTPILLGVVTMLFSLLPFGAPIVYLPVVIVMVGKAQYLAAGLLLLWCVFVVSTIDNIIRPYFVSRTTRAPIGLILLGLIGGVCAFNIIGLFIGPFVLVVASELLSETMGGERKAVGQGEPVS